MSPGWSNHSFSPRTLNPYSLLIPYGWWLQIPVSSSEILKTTNQTNKNSHCPGHTLYLLNQSLGYGTRHQSLKITIKQTVPVYKPVGAFLLKVCLWTGNIGITRKQVGAAEARTPLRPTESEFAFQRDLYAHSSLKRLTLEKWTLVEIHVEAPGNRFSWEARLNWVPIASANTSRKPSCCHPSFPRLPKRSFLNSNLVLLAYEIEIQSQGQTPDHEVHSPPLSPAPTFCPLPVCPNAYTPPPCLHTPSALMPLLILLLLPEILFTLG